MKWEIGLIEWIQKALGSLNSTVGTVLSFVCGEIGLMMTLLIILFCPQFFFIVSFRLQ